MHRPVRKTEREIGIDETSKLLASCPYGVLATVGNDGQPYGVPLSYVFHDKCIYFHCALEGHALDNIRSNSAVSFCVVGKTKTLPNQFSTEYESAVAFGVATEIFDDEKNEALLMILEKYSPAFINEGGKYIAGKFERTTVIKIDIKQLTGKARK